MEHSLFEMKNMFVLYEHILLSKYLRVHVVAKFEKRKNVANIFLSR